MALEGIKRKLVKPRLKEFFRLFALITALAMCVAGTLADSTLVTAGARARSVADSALVSLDTLPLPPNPFLAAHVNDGIFAYLIGLLDRGEYGVVTDDQLERVLDESGKHTRIPRGCIREFRRASIPGNGAWVRAVFDKRLDTAVPYDILGYHPGSLVSSKEATFKEQYFPRIAVPNPTKVGPANYEITDVYLWSLVDGTIEIDIDGWVDAIMGGMLDDTYIVALAVFRYEGDRLAMAVGFNHSGEGRSGALDLANDKIRFPSPDALKIVGRYLRARALTALGDLGIPGWIPPDRRSK